jgi:hypothetical protein
LLIEALVPVRFGLSTEPLHENFGLLGYREHPNVVRIDSLAGLRSQHLAGEAILHGGTALTSAHLDVAGLKNGFLDEFDYICGVFSGDEVSKL